jgi:hypothetical protein
MSDTPKRRGRPRKVAAESIPNGAQGEPATAEILPDLGGQEGRVSVVFAPAHETKGGAGDEPPEIVVACEAPAVAIPEPSPDEPERDPAMGDKTPALIEWRRKHWSAEAFAKVYPPSRKLPV